MLEGPLREFERVGQRVENFCAAGMRDEMIDRCEIQLLLAQEQARLTENSVRRVRESLDETRALNRGGLADDYSVLRLEVELANLEPNLRRANNAVSQARRNLAVLVNYPDHEGLVVEGSLA